MGIKQEINRKNLNKIRRILQFKQTKYDCEALHYACEKNNVEVVRLLLTSSMIDVNKNSECYNNRTPLEVACSNHNLDIVKILLYDPNVNHDGMLFFAIHLCDSPMLVKLLLDNFTIQTDVTKELYYCCNKDKYETFHLLLTHPNATVDVNRYPLIYAVCGSYHIKTSIKMPEVLLNITNIDVNKQGKNGHTPSQLCTQLQLSPWIGSIHKLKLLVYDPRFDIQQITKGRRKTVPELIDELRSYEETYIQKCIQIMTKD
jgi:ankyrin repeat protein